MPVKYQNAIIYKLCCDNPDIKEIYINGTCNLARRRHLHKTECTNETNKNYNNYVYRFIRNNGGWNNWSIVMVEQFSDCNSKLELDKRVRHHIVEHKATLHMDKQLEPNDTIKYDKPKRPEKKTCECGSTYSYYATNRHLKTKKHKRHMEITEELSRKIKQSDITNTPIDTPIDTN
jgi:hypothetical protein